MPFMLRGLSLKGDRLVETTVAENEMLDEEIPGRLCTCDEAEAAFHAFSGATKSKRSASGIQRGRQTVHQADRAAGVREHATYVCAGLFR